MFFFCADVNVCMWICLHIRCYWPTHSTICYKKDMQDIDQGLADWTIQKILKSQQKRRKANNRILSIVFSFWRFIHLVWSWNNSTQIYAAPVSTECSNYVPIQSSQNFYAYFAYTRHSTHVVPPCFILRFITRVETRKSRARLLFVLYETGNSLSCNCLSHLVSRSCLA